jgi:hypothetical protein
MTREIKIKAFVADDVRSLKSDREDARENAVVQK